ncbi:electron transport complex subunit RsxC [Parachitinimonas caeni]|uniref:Ion-translocating oxidoreductase complex subunit C n=1 Tax=Parachitinimonas caeni TaxID=3031301 RepID=A0ABT7DUB9_9NEIS|nr:electron transport complex subunit RsxC [Parachitinimonas caeni]MDK2123626.1 electron transport complex subunit RsxC [Parachitinimonas caeni]
MVNRPPYRMAAGIRLADNTAQAHRGPIITATLPTCLHVPLQTALSETARSCVVPGQQVQAGQKIADASGPNTVAIHAPAAGTVLSIGKQALAELAGQPGWCITIEVANPSSPYQATPLAASDKPDHLSLQTLGLVGLGGGGLPCHLRLHGVTPPIKTLIINGVECEPWLSCDDSLMREHADEIVAGIRWLQTQLDTEHTTLAIGQDKPAAQAAFKAVLPAGIQLVSIPPLYPAGEDRQLAYRLTGQEIPASQSLESFGIQSFNVATVHAIGCAILRAETLTSRIVTIAGNVARPGNYRVAFGTPVSHLLQLAGEQPHSTGYLVGNPMTGETLATTDAVIGAGAQALIAMNQTLFPTTEPTRDCIRCGECAEVCPIRLQPMQLWHSLNQQAIDQAQTDGLFDCIECGACSYVCPSRIPLASTFRVTKQEIVQATEAQQAADKARQRHEFRQFRLERDKQEKAERLAAKAAAKHEVATASSDPADAERAAKIKAAMERAAAKRAAAQAAATDKPAEPKS